ncbi:MAG: glycosyltransferase family 2 protein [Candidatus Hydrogenedentes bacterium]|nr:glycosyltransferase family 2 protein [Candidatus Hydrogenedentota bacterium]
MSSSRIERTPRVTIGIPAYRNARTIRATIDSVLAQSYGDFKVVISDDVSPDGTAEICRSIAATDSRITFVQQPQNLNYGNFRYLVNTADTEYFMWLAGDDTIAPDYVKENLRILEARKDVVLSVSKCLFVSGERHIGLATGTYPLMGPTNDNVLRYMFRPCDNTRMYGIFRTEVLSKSFPKKDFFGYDFVVSLISLLYGKHYEIPHIMMRRDYTPRENYVSMMRRDADSLISQWFPAWGLTKDAIGRPDFPRNWKTMILLFSVNIYHHYSVCAKYHPRYAALLPPLIKVWDRHVSWRANPWSSEEIAIATAEAEFDGR